MLSAPNIGIIKLILILPGIGYVLLVLFALLFANRLIFPAPPPGYSDSPDIIKFPYDAQGNAVSMVYLGQPVGRYLVFYQHGNGEDLQSVLPRLESLRSAGLSVLAWDYPGYGTSDGRPSEDLILEIAEGIWREIPKRYGYPHERVVLYGRSIGGGPAIWLASRHRAAGVILEGTFTSIFRVGLPVNILPWDVFDNLKRIASVQCPSLFIHGTADRTVPFSHSIELHANANAPKFFAWIEDGDHNDIIETYPDVYYSSLRRFLRFLSQS